MEPSGNTDTVTFTIKSFAQVRMNKAISGTMGGGDCERLIKIGIWDVGFGGSLCVSYFDYGKE